MNTFCNNQQLSEVTIQRSIFQGEIVSTLSFVTTFMLLSVALRKDNMHYKLRKNGPYIKHLFRNNVKLFAKTDPEMKRVFETEQMCCKDIGMEISI